MLSRVLLIVFLAGSSCWVGFAQCEPSPEIKSTLDTYAEIGRRRESSGEKRTARSQILEKALAAAPTDYFLLDRRRDLLDDNTPAGQEASISYFADLLKKYPDVPGITAVYADALRRKDPAQALTLLEKSEEAHPDFPWTRLKLISVLESGDLRDKTRIGDTAEAFLKICPATSSALVYRVLVRNGTQEQLVRHAGSLRARLQAQPNASNQNLWMVLWDLEFKIAGPSAHADVRKQIANDLAILEIRPDHNQLALLTCLRKGYADIGDKVQIDRIEAEISRNYPDSVEAEEFVTEQWKKEHPFPAGNDEQAKQAWYRASAAVAAEWYARWHGVFWLMQEFSAKAALQDTTPAELRSLGEKYVQEYHENPNVFYGALPMEFEVSDALIRKKVLLPAIPQWLDDGYGRETNRLSRLAVTSRDQMTEDQRNRADQQTAAMRIERARILLDYYDALGQRSRSRSIEDQLAGLNPTADRMKPALFEVRAKAAEMDGRKLDALILYQAASALGGKRAAGGKSDSALLDVKIASLWKELGGTPANLSLFIRKTKVEPISAISWTAPKHPLPPFTLTDLHGKVWTLADFNGKATLINVWATWCGPCQAEHADFQKLYDRLKNREDIAILSANVDDEAGLVAPYMAEHHYSFPVVLGSSLLDAVTGDGGVAIPQNWFLARTAKLEAIQLGYGGDPGWLTTMTDKLEQLLKAN